MLMEKATLKALANPVGCSTDGIIILRSGCSTDGIITRIILLKQPNYYTYVRGALRKHRGDDFDCLPDVYPNIYRQSKLFIIVRCTYGEYN